MATARRFEELDAWRDARVLARRVYEATSLGRFSKDFGLKDQIQRAAVSVMSNIAEGFERGSNAEFVRFLYMAKGSAGEVRSQLYVAMDLGYLDDTHAEDLHALAEQVSRRISKLISYLESRASTHGAGRSTR